MGKRATGSPYNNGDQVVFTFSSSGSLSLGNVVVSNTFTNDANATSSAFRLVSWTASTGVRYELAVINGVISSANVSSSAGTFLGQFKPVPASSTGGGTLPVGVAGKVVTMTYFCTNNPCGPYTHGQQLLFTFSSNGTLKLTAKNTVVSATFKVMPNTNPSFQSEYQWTDAGGQASGTVGTKYTLALTNNAPVGEILEVNINSASGTFLGQFNTPVSGASTGTDGTGGTS